MKLALLTTLIFFSFNNVLGETLMVSHKGAWKGHKYPQNTLTALEKAMENGFRGLEFDLQQTRDGVLVLGHDDGLKRISNCEGKISKSAWKNLKNCYVTYNTTLPLTQILRKKVKKPSRFDSLKEVLDKLLSKDNLEFMWLDLKVANKKTIDHLEGLFSLTDPELLGKIVINSVDESFLRDFKERLPHIKTSYEGKWGSEPLSQYSAFFSGIGSTHDFVSLNVGLPLGHRGSLNPFFRGKRFWRLFKSYMNESTSRGISTIGWTVNKVERIKRLKTYKIDYLLTDNLSPL